MDKFFRKTKGAISIFLVIVLLPMLTVSSVFVDMSRINLARSMAESAGDLTLNTALTNYDAELKNLYGLFATSQDMNELMNSLEDYYRDSIVAAGLDPVAAEDYVGQIMNYLKSTTGDDDLLNIQLSGFEASVPEGGNLGNPAILKSQIVEFMKYRAPLELCSGFLDALSAMKDLSKQTSLVEDKNEFYEQHQSLLDTLEDAWWQLQLYQYADANGVTGFPTGSYLTDQGSTMASNAVAWDDKDIVEKTVKYLYRGNFNKLWSANKGVYYKIELYYLCPDCNAASAENKAACISCGTSLIKNLQHQQWFLTWGGDKAKAVETEYSENNPATVDEVVEWLNAVLNAIEGVKNYTTGKGYVAANMPLNSSQVQSTYAVCVFNEELGNKNNNYLKSVATLLECLVKLNAAVNTCDAEELSNTRVKQIDGRNYKIETSAGGTELSRYISGNLKHLSLESGGYLDMFNQIVSRVNGHYDYARSAVDNAVAQKIPAAIDAIRDQAYNFDKKLEEKIGNLTLAISLLTSVKTSLTDTNSEYYKALENWKTSANNLSENTMGKNDLAEIEDITSVLTVDRLTSLITRLTNAKTTLENIRLEIAKFKFAGTSWKDIKDNVSLTDVRNMLSSWDADIKAIVPTGDNAYDSVISAIEATVLKGSITDTWGEGEYSPDLTDQQRELYSWLYNNFYQEVSDYSTATTPEQSTSGDEDMGKMEEDLKKQADEQKCDEEVSATTEVNRDISQYLDPKLKALPSTRWDDVASAIAAGKIQTNADEMLNESNKENDNMLETILNLAANIGRELRDNLYVAEYIMSMFSYDTIEAELYVKEKGSSNGYGAFYKAPAEGSEEYTVDENFKDLAAKIETLTNNSINPNMNYLYGGEVEYILYGENGTAGVYGTIFVLRFALNTVYAFMDAEINNVTLSAATALFGTPPLTPLIPFAKAAMTIGLAIAESAWDLVELRKGEAVPLMKNSQTWVMKPSGIASTVKSELVSVANNVVDKAVDKGYEMLNNAITMTSEELQKLIDESEDGLNSLVEAATTSVTDSLMNQANAAVQKVVELCNAANQKAMLSADYSGLGATDAKVQEVMNGLDAWLAQQVNDDPVVYEVKQAAVEYLKESGGKVISEVFNKIEEQTSPNALTTILETKIKEVQTAIEGKVNGLINQAGTKLSEMKNGLEEKLKNAAAEGAEELKQTLSNEISEAFGKIPEADGTVPTASSTNSVLTSLLSWAYSDYLRLFVVVGLFANEELMMLRVADMIELNMQKKNNEYAVITTTETVTKSRFFGLWTTTEEIEVTSVNKAAFSLSNSYTYLTVHTTVQVKPLMMTLPFMADTTENQLAGTNWYEIEYTGTLGY